ncbi:MAG: NADH-quinone oxidoreductase subunit C [Firmicutes bacterium]|nr:NADH-quinone oxidoreductase subunit C [Bacillota bacterium]
MSGGGASAAPFTGGAAATDAVRAKVVPELLAAFSDGVTELDTPFDIPQVQVAPGRLAAVARWLKERGFNVLVDVGGVDYLPRTPRFEVVYHLLALPQLWRLRLRVPVEEASPVVPTVSDLWPSATHAEREVWDLFGIRFEGHPELTRILMPSDWEGHPLRKDYPLQGPRAGFPAHPADRNRYRAPKLPGDPPGAKGAAGATKGGN